MYFAVYGLSEAAYYIAQGVERQFGEALASKPKVCGEFDL